VNRKSMVFLKGLASLNPTLKTMYLKSKRISLSVKCCPRCYSLNNRLQLALTLPRAY
jgi:hypothetical protein